MTKERLLELLNLISQSVAAIDKQELHTLIQRLDNISDNMNADMETSTVDLIVMLDVMEDIKLDNLSAMIKWIKEEVPD